jgi:hypothetical protein
LSSNASKVIKIDIKPIPQNPTPITVFQFISEGSLQIPKDTATKTKEINTQRFFLWLILKDRYCNVEK